MMEDNSSNVPSSNGQTSNENVLFKLYNILKSGHVSSLEYYLPRIQKDFHIILALWMGLSLHIKQIHNFFFNENARLNSLIGIFRENANDNLLTISAYLIAFFENNKLLLKDIGCFIEAEAVNSISYPQVEYIIEKILSLEMFDRVYELNNIQFLRVKMEEIELDEDQISFTALIIKVLMKKIIIDSDFLFGIPSVKNKNSFVNRKIIQKNKKSYDSWYSKSTSLNNFTFSKESKNDEQSYMKISSAFHEKNHISPIFQVEEKSIKLISFYYERLERIFHKTVKENLEDKNSEILDILLQSREFSLIFSYMCKDQFEKLILPNPKNFLKFYSKKLYNVVFFILDLLDAQYAQMLYGDEIHEEIISSFKRQGLNKEFFIDYEIKLLITKVFFVKNFSNESCKSFFKSIEEIITYNLKQFLFYSSNCHMRIILTAEIIKIISQRFNTFSFLSSKLISDLEKLFNSMIGSADISRIKQSLLERDYEERCVFDIIIENDFIDFLTTEQVKSIVIDEWNQNLSNIHSTSAINCNHFIFNAICTQFSVPNRKFISLFQDALHQTKENSNEMQFYFQFDKWKGNIQHKFLFESFGYLLYFLLMFIIFIKNMQAYSQISENLKKLSNEIQYEFVSIEDKFSFVENLNQFLINTKSLYISSMVLYSIFAEYLTKFAFSILTGCKFRRLVLDSWIFDLLLLIIVLIKDCYYLLFDKNSLCLITNNYLFNYDPTLREDSFFQFRQTRNITSSNEVFCEYFQYQNEKFFNLSNSEDNVIILNLAYEKKSDIFLILKELFFRFRMIGMSISAFLLKLLFYFKLNPTIGPFLEIIKYVVLQFLSFCFLLLVLVFIGTVFANFCFFDIDYRFTNFWITFINLWEIFIASRTGSDYFTYENKSKYLSFVDYRTITTLGQLAILVFTILTTLLILNLTIAMISTRYQQYYKSSKAIYCKDLIKFKNSHIYFNVYDSLSRAAFPFHLILIPFLFFFFFMKNMKRLRILNKIINFVFYIPSVLSYLVCFIISSMCYYIVNLGLLLYFIFLTVVNFTITFELMYFFVIYIFLGITFIFYDLFVFIRISLFRQLEKKDKPVTTNHNESTVNLKETKETDTNGNQSRKKLSITSYKFYLSSFQISETDSDEYPILTVNDVLNVLHFTENKMKNKIQLGHFIHLLCTSYYKPPPGDDNPVNIIPLRRNNLMGFDNKSNKIAYIKFQEILSLFDVFKDGYIDCESLYYSFATLLNIFLFKRIINDIQKRDCSITIEKLSDNHFHNENSFLPKEENKNFIILLERSKRVPFNFIGRNVIYSSINQNSDQTILKSSLERNPKIKDSSPKVEDYEGYLKNSDIGERNRMKQQATIDEIQENGSLSQNESAVISNSTQVLMEKVAVLESKVDQIERSMNLVIHLLTKKDTSETDITN